MNIPKSTYTKFSFSTPGQPQAPPIGSTVWIKAGPLMAYSADVVGAPWHKAGDGWMLPVRKGCDTDREHVWSAPLDDLLMVEKYAPGDGPDWPPQHGWQRWVYEILQGLSLIDWGEKADCARHKWAQEKLSKLYIETRDGPKDPQGPELG